MSAFYCEACALFFRTPGRDVHALLELAHLREEHDAWHRAQVNA